MVTLYVLWTQNTTATVDWLCEPSIAETRDPFAYQRTECFAGKTATAQLCERRSFATPNALPVNTLPTEWQSVRDADRVATGMIVEFPNCFYRSRRDAVLRHHWHAERSCNFENLCRLADQLARIMPGVRTRQVYLQTERRRKTIFREADRFNYEAKFLKTLLRRVCKRHDREQKRLCPFLPLASAEQSTESRITQTD